MVRNVVATRFFKRQKFALDDQQREMLNKTIQILAQSPEVGKKRNGELQGVYSYNYQDSQGKMQVVYKFDKTVLKLIGVFKLSQYI